MPAALGLSIVWETVELLFAADEISSVANTSEMLPVGCAGTDEPL